MKTPSGNGASRGAIDALVAPLFADYVSNMESPPDGRLLIEPGALIELALEPLRANEATMSAAVHAMAEDAVARFTKRNSHLFDFTGDQLCLLPSEDDVREKLKVAVFPLGDGNMVPVRFMTDDDFKSMIARADEHAAEAATKAERKHQFYDEILPMLQSGMLGGDAILQRWRDLNRTAHSRASVGASNAGRP